MKVVFVLAWVCFVADIITDLLGQQWWDAARSSTGLLWSITAFEYWRLSR